MDDAMALARLQVSLHEQQAAIDTIWKPGMYKDDKGWLTDVGKKALRVFFNHGIPANAAAVFFDVSATAVGRYYRRWK